MKRNLLFCLLLFPYLIRAQEPLLNADSLRVSGIYLNSGNWRFRAGDDIAWAIPAYNDKSWKKTGTYLNIQLGEEKKAGFTGRGWFRYHFRIDSSLVNHPIAIELRQTGASELYLDGKMYYRFGRFRDSAGTMTYINPMSMPLIINIPDTGRHVLAVRYENYKAAYRMKKYGDEMAGFRIKLADPVNSIDHYFMSDRTSTLPTLVCGSIFLALFIAHLLLFLYYREGLSNLLFSLFNLGFGLLFFLTYIEAHNTDVAASDKSTLYINFSLSISCFALSALVNNLFTRKRLRLWLITGLCISVVIISIFSFRIGTAMLGITGLICALEAVVIVCIAMYRRIKGARIIGVGILFFVLFFGSIAVVAILLDGIELNGGWSSLILLLLAILAIFSIPFSMSAYLAWNFACLNKDLKTQLHQVELLSAKNLEQEQEKQRILENRKEELETEIAHRTSEVLLQKGQIEQQHEALKTEKRKSDELLLNILPAEVAEELKEKGNADARNFNDVSVLFSDFVNFTHISEELSARDLVAELHNYFKTFDEIMERHGLEKIKTIGDAYLAVSGLPVSSPGHAQKAIRAAMDMIAYVKEMKEQGHLFDVRIGINSGSLVAGIVGVKKFAYDIWGDTVNTASRMESHGIAGKINISANTWNLVRNDFTCTYRGGIEVKGKGAMDMYFVEMEPVVVFEKPDH